LRPLRYNPATGRLEEKGIDVALALSVVERVIADFCDVAILSSHDTTFCPWWRVASQPFTDWGGFFWAQNVVAVGRMEPAQVRYDTPDRLQPGTHWVHVQTFDPECAASPAAYENVSCIVWSTAVSGTVARPENLRPELSFVRWASRAAGAVMRVCDDTFPGPLVFRTTLNVNRFGHGSATRRQNQNEAGVPRRGCGTYRVALPKLHGVDLYTLKMSVTDSRGARSTAIVRRWTTRD
jgi:hypothetical protein